MQCNQWNHRLPNVPETCGSACVDSVFAGEVKRGCKCPYRYGGAFVARFGPLLNIFIICIIMCLNSRLLTSRKKPSVPLRRDYPAAGAFHDIATLTPGKRRRSWHAMTLIRRRAFAFAVPGVSWMDDWAPSHTGHVLEVEVVNKEQWSMWVGTAFDAAIELYILYIQFEAIWMAHTFCQTTAMQWYLLSLNGLWSEYWWLSMTKGR